MNEWRHTRGRHYYRDVAGVGRVQLDCSADDSHWRVAWGNGSGLRGWNATLLPRSATPEEAQRAAVSWAAASMREHAARMCEKAAELEREGG